MVLKRKIYSALCVALITVCAVFPPGRSESALALTEVELKAVFLLRLLQFVSWLDQRSAKPCAKIGAHGEVAEWSKAHAWKVCIRQRIEGSNPSLSAIFRTQGAPDALFYACHK